MILLLNLRFQPLTIVNKYHATKLLISNKARAISHGPIIVQKEHLDITDELIIIGMQDNLVYTYNDILVVNTMFYRHRKLGHPSKNSIYKRDRNICCYCGIYCNDPTIDHVIPRSAGGKDTYKNLVTACRNCNKEKGNMCLDDFLVEYNRTMYYQPKTPAVNFSVFWRKSKPHWDQFLFY